MGIGMSGSRLGAATLALLTILAFMPGAWADYEAGEAAWEEGRHREAKEEWLSAAEAGDSRAMLALGRLYVAGMGAPQDYVEAHKWFNLAAGFGESEAVAERDALAREMTVEERAEARKLAREWRSSAANAGARDAPSAGESVQVQEAASAAPLQAGALREVQVLLARLGYEPGPADGIWGNRSRTAYRAFVRDAGLLAGDEPTAEAMEVLRAIAERYDADTPATSPPAEDPPAIAAVPTDAASRAAQAGNIDGLKAALAAGADVNARGVAGLTALMHVADKGYVLLLPVVLEADPDLDLRAPDGATALFIATVHGHSEVVSALVRAGADISIVGPRGKTAVDVAQAAFGDQEAKRADPAILALLEGLNWVELEGMTEEERERLARERLKREWPEGKVFRDCDECPEMIVVPAGSFEMGSPTSEVGRGDDEGPEHMVTIAEPFAVGKFEVTRGEFGQFVSATGHSTELCEVLSEKDGKPVVVLSGDWRSPPHFIQGDWDPVTCVNWNDAQAYVRWLSAKTGETYRLLSEAEWEYAARAGTQTPFHTGWTISTDQANFNGNWNYWYNDVYMRREGVKPQKTMPVGSFAGNKFGLHDMHGNVEEWVEDCLNENYLGAPSDGGAWEQDYHCQSRIFRGGSWASPAFFSRSANRSFKWATNRTDDLGFRVARTLTP